MASSVDRKFVDDDHATVMQQFEEYMDATINVRALAEKCRDYKDGNQWLDSERKTLKKRGQPCITDNKIQDKHDTLMGIEKQMRSDPKAFPRNPNDEGAAEAATDALRYIADCNDFNRCGRKPATDNLIVEGLCFGHVIVERQQKKYVKISMEHIRWDRGYVDIHALRDDFDDKTYCGYFRWMDADKVKREFHGRDEVIEQSMGSDGSSVANAGTSADDKPRYVMSVRKRPRLQVFKHFWIKDGVWHEGIWASGGWLEDPKPCEYKDEDGQPMCCMEIQALYRDGDGNPYGAVPRWLDLQDEHNKRRSKMLHLLNAKRIFYREGEVDDIGKLRNELHKPDGAVSVKGDITQIRVEDNISEAEGQWRLLQQTDQALAATGPNAALQGNSGSQSGRAKQLDQQAGSLMVSPVFEALDSWELRMYRQSWYRVKQYWTGEMWVRVTDNDDNPKFVGLNQPVLTGDAIAERLKNEPIPPEEKAAIIQQIAADPMSQTPYIENGKPKVKNEVAMMDVDIIIDRTQDTVNIQQEQFEILATLADKRPEVRFDTLVKLSALRSDVKKQVLDSGKDDPAAQQQAQFQQMMQQMQALLMEAQVRRENAAAAKDEQATVESQVDASVKVATFTEGDRQAATGQKSSVSVN